MGNISTKKRVVISYKNLSEEIKEALKKKYPFGFQDNMIRIDKCPGDFFYAVMYESEDTNYLIKVDVKIDDKLEEEEDKDYYDDEIKGADELADDEEEEE